MTQEMPPKKRGNRLGFWFFRAVLKTSGLKAAYAFLYPVCAYYLLLDRAAFRASDAYIRRRFPASGFIRRCLGVLRLYVSQGKNLVDRYVSTDSGLSLFDTEVAGYDKMIRVLGESDRGAVLLTAHIGNWQMTMPALGGLGRPVYLMMRPEENAAVSEALRLYEERDWLRILDPKDFSGALEALEAIKNGGLVSIMGDRGYGHRTGEVTFLGDTARLPYGAFAIAAAAGCPVFVMLSAKVSERKYVVDFSNVITTGQFTRKTRRDDIKGCVRQYAAILERYVEQYPYQWFVFHDIWGDNE